MANPPPDDVHDKTARTKAEEKASASEPEPASASASEPELTGQRYLVLKAVTDEDGKTWMPGDEFVPGPAFPSRRPKQLVDQKYLRPIG